MRTYGNNTLVLMFDEVWNENILISSRILALLSLLSSYWRIALFWALG